MPRKLSDFTFAFLTSFRKACRVRSEPGSHVWRISPLTEALVIALFGLSSACGTPKNSGNGKGGTVLTPKQTLIPHASWSCWMPDGIPPVTNGELVFEVDTTLGEFTTLA